MKENGKLGVLFCCTANICRSPTAEAMFRSKATQAGIIDRLIIDSAGTHDFHVGEPPDARAQAAARGRGYDLSALRARKVRLSDLELFSFVLAMDMANLTVLHRLGEPDLWQKPKLMMSYSKLYKTREVPDPYGGGADDFELVLDMLDSATDGLLVAVENELLKSGTTR
ncbi:MAG: low molecular weight protein-tyrosine-phosphatase [Sideroxyarcus sp.]|nr:low molecular weight protein-tyrosine-phosphatase [Sideroxyarcus sp.]